MISTNRIGRMCALLMLALSCVIAPLLRAQEKQKEPAPPQQQQAKPQQPSHPDSDRPSVSIGQQLAHETREAAGEEKDETAVFKQSASVSWISRKLHISLLNAYWLSIVLNFAVIAIVVVWAGKKFLPAMFDDRTAAIQKAMREAQKASEEARRRLAEIESRLRKLDVEIGMMRDAAERESAAEEARIQVAAEDDARKIVAAAEQEIGAAAKAARRQLTAHAADLAVALAQKQIRVDAATDQALVRNFAGQLDAASDQPGKDRS